jgi:hypothetical protein
MAAVASKLERRGSPRPHFSNRGIYSQNFQDCRDRIDGRQPETLPNVDVTHIHTLLSLIYTHVMSFPVQTHIFTQCTTPSHMQVSLNHRVPLRCGASTSTFVNDTYSVPQPFCTLCKHLNRATAVNVAAKPYMSAATMHNVMHGLAVVLRASMLALHRLTVAFNLKLHAASPLRHPE